MEQQIDEIKTAFHNALRNIKHYQDEHNEETKETTNNDEQNYRKYCAEQFTAVKNMLTPKMYCKEKEYRYYPDNGLNDTVVCIQLWCSGCHNMINPVGFCCSQAGPVAVFPLCIAAGRKLIDKYLMFDNNMEGHLRQPEFIPLHIYLDEVINEPHHVDAMLEYWKFGGPKSVVRIKHNHIHHANAAQGEV